MSLLRSHTASLKDLEARVEELEARMNSLQLSNVSLRVKYLSSGMSPADFAESVTHDYSVRDIVEAIIG
jgi:hypothetical protein